MTLFKLKLNDILNLVDLLVIMNINEVHNKDDLANIDGIRVYNGGSCCIKLEYIDTAAYGLHDSKKNTI